MEKKPSILLNTPDLPMAKNSSSSVRQITIPDALDDSKPSTSTAKNSFWRAKDVSLKSSASKEEETLFIDQDSFGTGKRKFQFRPKTDSAKDEYEFPMDRNPSKAANIKTGVAALVKGCLGGGMVAIHEAYMECGLWTALTINILLGIIITYCMYILTQSAQKLYVRIQVSTLSYPDLAEAALEVGPSDLLRKCSRCFRHTVETFICIGGFGACCAYQVMIARAIKQLFESTDDVDISVLSLSSIRVYIAVLMIPCILLVVFTTVKVLSPFSVVANFYVVLIAISTIYFGSQAAKGSPLDMPAFKSLTTLFKFTGVVMFSFDGIGVILVIEHNIKNPKQFPHVLAGGMTVVMLTVIIIGFFGYWGYQENCVSPVTVNFPWHTYPITLKMFLAMMIFMTFGLNFCNPFNILWYYIAPYHDPDRHWLWERVYRAVVVIGTSLISIALPDLNSIIGLLGSFCLSYTGCIFPAFISMVLDWEKPGPGRFYWRLWKTILLILLGVFLFVVGTITNAWDLVRRIYYPDYPIDIWG